MTTGDSASAARDFVIEPAELRALDGEATLIDARTEPAYAQGHIPGAVFLTTYHFFVPNTSSDGMAAFMADVTACYAAVGVSHDRPGKFTTLVNRDLERWGKVVNALGLRVE